MGMIESDKDEFVESLEYVPDDFAKTQDQLEPAFEPSVADDERKDETPAVEEITTEVSAKTGESTDDKPRVDLDSINETLKKVQDRLEKAEARAGYWQRQAEKKQPEVPPGQPKEDPAVELPPKPKYDDFETDEAYYEALTDYKVEAKLRTFEAQRLAQSEQAQAQEQVKSFTERMIDDGTAKYGDFYEVVSDPTIPITNQIFNILRETERPADIAYFLGKNPKEAVRISRLAPFAAAKEIGRIEEKIMADEVDKPTPGKPKPTVSNAPPPINPIRGGQTVSVHKNPDKMTNVEYRAWRRGQKG